MQDIKYNNDLDRHERIFFYANVNHDRPTIHPWQRCLYKKGHRLSNEYLDDGDTIVISDSDDDEDANDLPVRCKLDSTFFFQFSKFADWKMSLFYACP